MGNCPKFKSADQAGKTAMLQQVKNKVGYLCKYSSSYTHKSESCWKKFTCNICQENHLACLHEFQTILSCAVSNIIASARMSLQDIKISEGSRKPLFARVLFDNGGQVALARNKFCQQAGFKSRKASYTISGVVGEPQVYTPANGGKIWTVVLRDNKGVLESIEAYGVPQVLLEPIGHGQLNSYRKKFPNVAAEVFDELPDKELDLLVGNAYLGLHPKCSIGGFDCKDCNSNLCCFKSRFSHGHVLIGNTADSSKLASKAATVSRIALCQATATNVHTRRAKGSKRVHAAVTKGKLSTITAADINKTDEAVNDIVSQEDSASTEEVLYERVRAAAVSERVNALTAEGHDVLELDKERMTSLSLNEVKNWIPVSTAMAILSKAPGTASIKEDSTDVFSTVPAIMTTILTKVPVLQY